MKILLQNTKTLKFIRGEAVGTPGWTSQRGQARDFINGLAALFFCYNGGCEDMRMCVEFANPRLDFSVAVSEVRAA